MEHDVQFLDFVIKALVENPQDVKITRTVDEMGVLMTLDVNPADMGKIIGREGNTAKAIRTLLRVVGMKNNARVNLKINEPAGGIKEVKGTATKSLDDALSDLGDVVLDREAVDVADVVGDIFDRHVPPQDRFGDIPANLGFVLLLAAPLRRVFLGFGPGERRARDVKRN